MDPDVKAIIDPWAGTHALYWYRHNIIPSFNKTAEELVNAGMKDALLEYLHRIEAGGFA